jgi:hypothetical protein
MGEPSSFRESTDAANVASVLVEPWILQAVSLSLCDDFSRLKSEH